MTIIEEFFKGNAWLNIVFFILSVLGIILAPYFYFKSKKEKRPVYNIKTISLFDANPIIAKKLEIKYNNIIVNSLLLTKIAFWNAGRDSIKLNDIATNDPFLIIAPGDTTIYDFEIIDQNPVNNFKIDKINEQTLKISFDFIDFGEGVIINIFRNKTNSGEVNVKGTFIGAQKISKGINLDKISDAVLIFGKPYRYLSESKSFVLRFLSWVLFFPTLVILIPLLVISALADTLMNRLNNQFPKKYFLDK